LSFSRFDLFPIEMYPRHPSAPTRPTLNQAGQYKIARQ